jgi:WD40 repeat protein
MNDMAAASPVLRGPWLLQQQWDGRLSGRQYRERYRQHRLGSSEWHASPYVRIRTTAQQVVTTTMDVHAEDPRFLLSGSSQGTISIYNLWEASDTDRTNGLSSLRPWQETVSSAPHRSITTVQWYPVDTGIFLSAAASAATLWDTARMTPVLSTEPYSDSVLLTCLHQGRPLAAVGSDRFRGTQLIDWRAGGAATHTLCYGSGTRTGAPPAGTVGAVQWSPLAPGTLLATCTDGRPYVWDIRHTSGPLIECGGPSWRPSTEDDRTIVRACRSLESMYGKFRRNHARPEVSVPKRPCALSFDRTGQYLIAAGHERETAIQVFDLLSLGKGDSLPLRAKTVLRYGHQSGAVPSMLHPVVLVTGTSPSSTWTWIPQGNALCAYSLLGTGSPLYSRPRPEPSDDPDVRQILRGHLAPIRCGVVASTRRSEEAICTAAEDQTIVVWEPKAAVTRKRPRNDDTDTWV